MMFLTDPGQSSHHDDRFVFGWLIDFYHLEPPCQGSVFFKILFVLCPCGCRNSSECPSGKGWLEQVGGIACACRSAGPNQCMGFVNK